MKFKYKKIILIITMCTMCIGMVTISLSTPKGKGNQKKNNLENIKNPFVELSDDATLKEEAGVEENSDLQSNTEKEIDQLIATYLNCMLTCDLQTLAKVVTDVENVDVEKMQAKQKLIEEYQNIECYTVDGMKKGEYLVYVYSESKFTGIDTAAPGLERYYVVTDTAGNLKIEFGLIKQEVQDFINETDESDDVQKIINRVNTKLEEAIANDSKLKEFYEKSGYMNNTPADLFEKYLKTGMGGEPMIVDYEKSIIEFANSNPEGFEQVKKDIRILYPTPTIWNSHCIATFNENGNQFYQAFEDKEIQQVAWSEYGFRTGITGGNYDVSGLGIGIPQNITSTVSSLKMDVYNQLIEYLKGE